MKQAGLRRAGVPVGPILIIALGGCSLSMLAATLAIRLHEAGFSARLIGLNASAAGIAALAVAPMLPAAAARIGAARVLLLALLLAAGALAGFALVHSFAVWLLLRAVEGGCATAMFVLGEYWITARVPDRSRGLVIGLYVAGVGASFALGPLLLSVLDPRSVAPFLVGIGFFAVAAAVLRATAGGAPAIAARRRSGLLGCYAAAPRLMTAATLHGAIETSGLNLLPVYGGGRGAAYAALFIIAGGMLQLPVGIVAGRVGRLRMLHWLAALAAAGATALALVGPGRPMSFAIGLVLWGGVVGSFYPVGLGELPRRFDADRLVGANASFVLAYGVGTLIGPPLVGAAMDLAPGGFFLALAAANLGYLMLALRRPAGRAP